MRPACDIRGADVEDTRTALRQGPSAAKLHASFILDEEWSDARPSWLEEIKHFAADFTPRKNHRYVFNGFHGDTLDILDRVAARPPPKNIEQLCCHIGGDPGEMVDEEDRVVCKRAATRASAGGSSTTLAAAAPATRARSAPMRSVTSERPLSRCNRGFAVARRGLFS